MGGRREGGYREGKGEREKREVDGRRGRGGRSGWEGGRRMLEGRRVEEGGGEACAGQPLLRNSKNIILMYSPFWAFFSSLIVHVIPGEKRSFNASEPEQDLRYVKRKKKKN